MSSIYRTLLSPSAAATYTGGITAMTTAIIIEMIKTNRLFFFIIIVPSLSLCFLCSYRTTSKVTKG